MKRKLSYFMILAAFVSFGVLTSCGDEEATENTDTEEVAEIEEATETEEVAAVNYTAGEELYAASCQACHMENGEGVEGTFPGLVGKACDVNVVVNGTENTAMVAFKDQLSDQEIADLINYVNHAWENSFDDIKAEDVAAIR